MLHRRPQGFCALRSGAMAKFEALAFALGFVATGLITFVALPLA